MVRRFWLRSNDLTSEAPSAGIVQMNVLDLIVAEVFQEFPRREHAVAHTRGEHHVGRVVGTHGHEATSDVTWNLADVECALPGAAANEDRPGCAVWRGRRLVKVGQKQQLFSDTCVFEADSARKAGALGSDTALRTMFLQLVIRQLEKWLERFVADAEKPE